MLNESERYRVTTHGLFYYVQWTWIYISNINVFSQLNDLVYMSCGKQMEWNISIEFHLPFFFILQFKTSNLFLAAISKTWPAFGHWQPAISSPVHNTCKHTPENRSTRSESFLIQIYNIENMGKTSLENRTLMRIRIGNRMRIPDYPRAAPD